MVAFLTVTEAGWVQIPSLVPCAGVGKLEKSLGLDPRVVAVRIRPPVQSLGSLNQGALRITKNKTNEVKGQLVDASLRRNQEFRRRN